MNENRVYRILVEGDLDPAWSTRLGGMAIEIDRIREPRTAILTGSLPDQSALTGVLNTLVDLRQTVVSVETLNENG
jgi:hypothetical protein